MFQSDIRLSYLNISLYTDCVEGWQRVKSPLKLCKSCLDWIYGGERWSLPPHSKQQTHLSGFNSWSIAWEPQSSRAISKRMADEPCMEDRDNKEWKMKRSCQGNWLVVGVTEKKFLQVLGLLWLHTHSPYNVFLINILVPPGWWIHTSIDSKNGKLYTTLDSVFEMSSLKHDFQFAPTALSRLLTCFCKWMRFGLLSWTFTWTCFRKLF